MDTSSLTGLLPALGTLLLRLVAALIVLFIGWLIARWLGNLTTKLLHRFNVDDKTADWAGEEEDIPQVEEGVGKLVYYLLMLFVLLAFFEVLGMSIITEPLNALLAAVGAFIPSLIAAGALAIAAWIIASILRGITRRALQAAGVDKRVAETTESDSMPISKGLSEAVYWLVWLIFLPPILGALGLQSLVDPLVEMFNELLGYIPNILAAAIIVLVGWFVARIVRRIVTSFLVAIGTDDFSDRIGLGKMLGENNLSGLLGLLTFIVILIPVSIAALEALQMTALTAPLSSMLESIFLAIPAILVAALILLVAYIFGKLLADLVTNLLEGIGFDNILITLGVSKEPMTGRVTPSQIVGYLVLLGVMVMAVLGATSLLNFPALSLVVTQFLAFAWRIVVGLVIFGIGLWLANVFVNAIEASNWPQKRLAAIFTRITVLVLAGAMALSQMGLADSIINLAFGLTLGGIALAVALAFGLGGRDVAERELESWVATVHEEGSTAMIDAPASDPSEDE
jgi:small-conductance mechanosensitive channel